MARQTQDRPAPRPPANWSWLPIAVLLAANLAIYAQTAGFDFFDWDDGPLVYDNPHVRQGLTFAGILWAWTTNYVYWQPLVWLSHMAAVSLFGLDAGPHHLINVLLHAANAILLFLLLRRMTGALWSSAVSAALFSLHPLRVESVAWVAERKDVLSSFFWLLAMWMYVRYAEKPADRRRYWLTLGAFALGLMSKPMLITFPVALLLLDYWPLRRWESTPGSRLIKEKIPMVVMSAASLAATFAGQMQSDAVATVGKFPIALRLENALVSYVAYLGDLFWPVSLAVLYPYPKSYPIAQVLASAALLGAITWLAVSRSRAWPWFTVGWFWYLLTLVPVIGLVQVGLQPRADRFTYVPMIMLTVALVWAGQGMLSPRHLVLAGCALSAVLAWVSWVQTGHWRNSLAIYEHAVGVKGGAGVVHNSLGVLRAAQNRPDEALQHYLAAVQSDPDFAAALVNLGAALMAKGQPAQALPYLESARRVLPNSTPAHFESARALTRLGRAGEAVAEYRKALALGFDARFLPGFHMELGIAEEMRGDLEAALAAFNEAARLAPNMALAHRNAAIVLNKMGRRQEAVEQFSIYLTANPSDSQTRRVMESLRAAPAR